MKISVITACFNSDKTISACVRSVATQSYPKIEYIIIDGGSKDSTQEIIREQAGGAKMVSEPDRGIYDAMNKGLALATGDIVGFLNSDDMYAGSDIIETVAREFSIQDIDSCYGDLVYVDRDDTERVCRYWTAGEYESKRFRGGWMPPHPTFFARREVYEKYGLFNLAFPVAADYEIMLRFLYKYKISTTYIPKVLVKMRTGGRSRPGILNTAKNMAENYRAWKVNELESNPLTFVLKPLSKATQYISSKYLP